MPDKTVDLFRTKKCKLCKKEIIVYGDDWAYKREVKHHVTNYYCSWKCFRLSEQTQNRRKKGNPKSEHAEEICRMLAENHTPKEICEKLGVSLATVQYWRVFGGPEA